MKHILLFLLNLLLLLFLTISDFVLFCWYGQLPKVSKYHQLKGYANAKQCFTDKNVQSKNHPYNKPAKEVLDILSNHKELKSIFMYDCPILDDEGISFGTQTVYSKIETFIRNNPELFINKETIK